MATITRTHTITLSTVEVGHLLKKALADAFDKDAFFSVDFIIGTKYDPSEEISYDAVTGVKITGTIENKSTTVS